MKREHRLQLNGVTLQVLEYGSAKAEPIIFLHGFPDFSHGWRQQIPFFEEQGFRLFVPDQRGYNRSDKPSSVKEYSLDHLAGDILALLDHFELPQAHLVGHDWGGIVAWWLALKHPKRLKRVAILNVPHPQVLRDHLRHNRTQLRKSWYMLAFQLPWLPEKLLSSGQFIHFQQSMSHSARRGAITPTDLEKYRAAWAQPGALTGMLNWYRAMFRTRPKPPASLQVTLPTLLIYGGRDPFLGEELIQPSLAFCTQGELEVYPSAGHFTHLDENEEVNHRLLTFFRP